MNTITAPQPTTFPVEDIKGALEKWWAEEQENSIPAAPAPTGPVPSILTPVVEIDSHRAVRAILTVEEVIDVPIPETIIKEGGYDTFEEMVEDLLPKIHEVFVKEWKKSHG